MEKLGKTFKNLNIELKDVLWFFGLIFGANMLGNIGKIIGTGGVSGGGILGIVSAIGLWSYIRLGVEVKELKKEINKSAEANYKAYKNWIEDEKDLNKVLDTSKSNRQAVNELIEKGNTHIGKMLGLNEANVPTLIAYVQRSKETLDNLKGQLEVNKDNKEETDRINENIGEQYAMNLKIIDELKKMGVDTKDLVKINGTYKQHLADQVEALEKQGDNYDQIAKKLGLTNIELSEIVKIANVGATLKVEADTAPAKKKLSTFFKGLGKTVVSSIFPGFPALSTLLSKIASLDTGTGYVPSDTLAMIHKGEAVIPKKFNAPEYFGSGNSELIAEMRATREAIERIEINPYTTIKDVGSTSVNYINQQKRILGREVV